jgi:hypothetical protein
MVINCTIFCQQTLEHYQHIQDPMAITAIKDGVAVTASYQTETLAIVELLIKALAGRSVS